MQNLEALEQYLVPYLIPHIGSQHLVISNLVVSAILYEARLPDLVKSRLSRLAPRSPLAVRMEIYNGLRRMATVGRLLPINRILY